METEILFPDMLQMSLLFSIFGMTTGSNFWTFKQKLIRPLLLLVINIIIFVIITNYSYYSYYQLLYYHYSEFFLFQ
jgi:putative effector of murein hydrolase